MPRVRFEFASEFDPGPMTNDGHPPQTAESAADPDVWDAKPRSGTMATSVEAPITGTVWRIEVGAGDKVEEGETLVLLESMKMELPVESPTTGQVESIEVREGQAVEEGTILLTIR